MGWPHHPGSHSENSMEQSEPQGTELGWTHSMGETLIIIIYPPDMCVVNFCVEVG